MTGVNFGKCDVCGDVIVPKTYYDNNRHGIYVSHGECMTCGKKIIVDDDLTLRELFRLSKGEGNQNDKRTGSNTVPS